MAYDPWEYLVLHGRIDPTPCSKCKGAKPPEFNASKTCPACLRKEFEEDGLPLESFDRLVAGIRAAQ